MLAPGVKPMVKVNDKIAAGETTYASISEGSAELLTLPRLSQTSTASSRSHCPLARNSSSSAKGIRSATSDDSARTATRSLGVSQVAGVEVHYRCTSGSAASNSGAFRSAAPRAGPAARSSRGLARRSARNSPRADIRIPRISCRLANRDHQDDPL